MRRGPALVLAGAVAVYVGVTVTYALTVPVGSSADEDFHLNYARLIADHGALPGAAVRERQQPPLYYLLSAGLLRAGAGPVALRFLSIVLGAVTIACVALAVHRLVPRRPWLWAGTAAAMALLPGFQFVSASITDDSIATAAAALLVLVTTHVALAAAPTRRLLLAIGCSIGVALLAKETDLPLVLVLAGVVAWRWRNQLTIAAAATIGLPIALLAGWWYARNVVTFHRPLPPLTPIGVPPDRMRTIAQARSFVTQSIRGLFSPERYQGAPLTLPLLGRVLIVVLTVMLLALVVSGTVLGTRSWARWASSRRVALIAYGLAALGAVLFSVGNAVFVVFQPQGRYLLVAAPGALLAAVWAIGRFGRVPARVAALACAGAAAALAVSLLGLSTAMSGVG